MLTLAITSRAQFNTVSSHVAACRQAETLNTENTSVNQSTIIETDRTTGNAIGALPLRQIYITSDFGERADPFTGKRCRHNGLDLRARYEPAYAMFYGKVIRTGKDRNSGLFVTLQHGNITVSYCHLSQIIVRKGDLVAPGDTVAITGNTGRSTAPHLHITCRYYNDIISPRVLFKYILSVQ